MDSVHSLIRRELCALVSQDWPEVSPDAFDMDCSGGEISAPLGYRPGPSDVWWLQRLKDRMESAPPVIFEEKLLGDISCANGHLLFHLSDDAYQAIILHIIKNYPKPKIPEDTSDIVSYAAARMLMLARKGGCGCPDPFKKGLWLCLCIEGFQGKKRQAVRKRAAEALLGAMDGLNGAERDTVRNAAGACAAAAAALLTINSL